MGPDEIERTTNKEFRGSFSIVLIKLLLLSYLALLAFPFRFSPIDTGLDPSWTFAINYFFHKGFIFGRDVIWTYGPLGFLSYPLDVGTDLDIATLFQIFVWSVFVIIMTYFSLKNHFSSLQLFFFVLLFACGQSPYYLGYIGYDYFLSFFVLLFLSLSLSQTRWHVFFIAGLLLSVILMFIKFSAAVVSIVSVILYILTLLFIDRGKAIKAAGFAAGMPVIFFAAYMSYCPSLSSLNSYLTGAAELISGYNTAMSKSGSRTELMAALLAALLYVLMIILLYRNARTSFTLSLMLTGPLFVAFKHGFVRQDTHVMIFFSFGLFTVGLILLLTDLRKIIIRTTCLVAAFVAVWVFVCLNYVPPKLLLAGVTGTVTFRNMTTAATYEKTKAQLNSISQKNLERVILNKDLLKEIGTKPVGIFPWEISYVAANNFNYVPFPVFQTDNAYTSYLDRLNRDFLENGEKAPALILMEWKSVDGRHPLIDVPAMWLSVFKWYDAYKKNDTMLFMKRRTLPKFSGLEFIEKKAVSKRKVVNLPVMDIPLFAKIHLTLKTSGKLSKLFFRVEEVRMTLFLESGQAHDYRVVADTLDDGLLINFLPHRLNDVQALLKGGRIERVKGFKLHGEGLHSYERTMIVEFYEIPDMH